jgi:hypothetical protein
LKATGADLHHPRSGLEKSWPSFEVVRVVHRDAVDALARR